MRKCYVCRKHIDQNETFFVDPRTARIAEYGVAFCMDCIPKQ